RSPPSRDVAKAGGMRVDDLPLKAAVHDVRLLGVLEDGDVGNRPPASRCLRAGTASSSSRLTSLAPQCRTRFASAIGRPPLCLCRERNTSPSIARIKGDVEYTWTKLQE